jgi:ATP-dependent DNA ligase
VGPRVCAAGQGSKLPATEAWLHEVKYDGYRLVVIREGARVRLMSRGGGDYAKRFPSDTQRAIYADLREDVPSLGACLDIVCRECSYAVCGGVVERRHCCAAL